MRPVSLVALSTSKFISARSAVGLRKITVQFNVLRELSNLEKSVLGWWAVSVIDRVRIIVVVR